MARDNNVDPLKPKLLYRDTEITSNVRGYTLPEVISFLKECIVKYGDKATLDISTEWDYDHERGTVSISWREYETVEELNTRLKHDADRVNAEKALYESLKKKYEKDA